MHKPKLIICTVGTSLAINSKINIESIENRPLTKEKDFDNEIKNITQKIRSTLSKLDLTKKEDLKKTSAEIKSLVKIGLNKTDQICLFCTDTIDGMLCGRIVGDYVTDIFGCRAFIQGITGLQVQDGEKFRNEGIHNLLNAILDKVEPSVHSYNIILNPTGGFKAIVPYTAIVGMIYGLSIKYIFEKSDQLLSFPLIPLDFKLGRFDLIYEKLEKLEKNIMKSFVFWEGIKVDYEDRGIFSGIIEEAEGLVDFSPIGKLLFLRYKKQKGVKLYFSTKANGIYNKLQCKQKESMENYLNKMKDPIHRKQHLHGKLSANIDAKCYKEPHTAERIFYYDDGEALEVVEIFVNHDEYERFVNSGKIIKERYTFCLESTL